MIPPTCIIIINVGSDEDRKVDGVRGPEDAICVCSNEDLTVSEHSTNQPRMDNCEESADASFCDTGLTVKIT